MKCDLGGFINCDPKRSQNLIFLSKDLDFFPTHDFGMTHPMLIFSMLDVHTPTIPRTMSAVQYTECKY